MPTNDREMPNEIYAQSEGYWHTPDTGKGVKYTRSDLAPAAQGELMKFMDAAFMEWGRCKYGSPEYIGRSFATMELRYKTLRDTITAATQNQPAGSAEGDRAKALEACNSLELKFMNETLDTVTLFRDLKLIRDELTTGAKK